MKYLILSVFVAVTLIACQPTSNVDAVFEANAVTIGQGFADFAAESDDFFTHFNENAIWRGTSVGSADSIPLADMEGVYKQLWAKYDYRLVSEAQFLPGVNADTKQTDGSVRGYFRWEVSKAATDSTEQRSVEVKVYESFDFNAEGEIMFTQVYGDLATAYGLLEE